MPVRIVTYNESSAGATILAVRMNLLRARRSPERSRIRDNGAGYTFLNWGLSTMPPHLSAGHWINHPDAVARAIDKTEAFIRLSEQNISVVPFTRDRATASAWIRNGHTVVARHLTRGSQGRGIQLIERTDDLSNAPLYTRYTKKEHEYRVHVIGDFTSVRQKLASSRVPRNERNYKIRSLSNGFIYASELTYDPGERLVDLGRRAVQAVGLHFGAVDIIYNRHRDQLYVLEINTAPGIVGRTVDEYVTNLRTLIEAA